MIDGCLEGFGVCHNRTSLTRNRHARFQIALCSWCVLNRTLLCPREWETLPVPEESNECQRACGGMSVGQCIFCESDTTLTDSGESPVCPGCSAKFEQRLSSRTAQKVRLALIQDLVEATRREKAASDEFNAAISQFPGGLPHPDGSRSIKNASCKLIAARKEMGRATSRLNDFLDRGIVPAGLAGRK